MIVWTKKRMITTVILVASLGLFAGYWTAKFTIPPQIKVVPVNCKPAIDWNYKT